MCLGLFYVLSAEEITAVKTLKSEALKFYYCMHPVPQTTG